MGKIVDIEIAYVNERLKEQGLEVTLTASAKQFFIDKGFDPVFGARPLKRVIQRYLEDPLSEDIIRGEFAGKENKDKPKKIKVTRKGEELRFE